MPALDMLRAVLRRLDRVEDALYSFDEVQRWRTGTLEKLLATGVLRETSPAREVACGNCADGCLVAPEIAEDPATGEFVCSGWCRDPDCGGSITFSVDRLRQWEPSFDGLAAFAAQELGTTGDVMPVVPNRIARLGSLALENRRHDAFLARGLTWSDATDTIRLAQRLDASGSPFVLVPAQLPASNSEFARFGVASLADLLTDDGGEFRLDRSRLPTRGEPTAISHPNDQSANGPTALTRTESDVLEAFAANRDETMCLVELAAEAGYGKKALRAALARLLALGLVAKPDGTQRKGAAITPAGLALIERASRTLCDSRKRQ